MAFKFFSTNRVKHHQRTLLKLKDVFAMRAHYGWVHYLSRKLARHIVITKPLADSLHNYLCNYTDKRASEFDENYGTETFHRCPVAVSENLSIDAMAWGYGPINEDFFREIIDAIPIDVSQYTFVDVGAGKGNALILAGEYNFKHSIGIELSEELINVGKLNIEQSMKITNRKIPPEWIQKDFLTWQIPVMNSLFFFNNPLPHLIALEAVQRIEETVAKTNVDIIVAYRKAPGIVDVFLSKSPYFRPLRLAPYWRIYRSINGERTTH
jgi:SAM-dependent methyltransferase